VGRAVFRSSRREGGTSCPIEPTNEKILLEVKKGRLCQDMIGKRKLPYDRPTTPGSQPNDFITYSKWKRLSGDGWGDNGERFGEGDQVLSTTTKEKGEIDASQPQRKEGRRVNCLNQRSAGKNDLWPAISSK